MTEKKVSVKNSGQDWNCLQSKFDSSCFIGTIEHDGNRIVDDQKETVIQKRNFPR